MQVLTQIKRGLYEGKVLQDQHQYYAYIYHNDKILQKSEAFFDQDEAEVHCGTLLDEIWRKSSSAKSKLVRRI